MKLSSTALLASAAAVAVLGGAVTSASAEAAPTHDTTVRTAAEHVLAARSAQPPAPGRQDRYRSTDSVRGLTRAVDRASHPGLELCGGDFASLVTATGDLRGDGHTGYLVDTTCAGATGSTPDEVALYESTGHGTARSAVLSAATATPRTSAYPYTWGAHTVVLAYRGDTQYRLVRLTPHAVDRGPLVAFR
ncbi:hypothetical protein [Curtobacterium luteum]|uniref:Uncharacterized protein n=1 Tax=Curtobacterium luteum TaxID=33881 RepID=A0A175RJT3_9MICO|nr:hypothetical protein [Curtobacterium luteum]KTR03613.1 hypothetical protein NS184_13385 [Curtobacterium luteum]